MDSIHLLARLWKIAYLSRFQVYFKRIQLRDSQMEDLHRAKYVGRGASMPSQQTPPSQHLHNFPNPKAL